MGSIFGRKIKVSIFGESHGEKIGVVLDGLPPNFEIDLEKIQVQMNRRAPGKETPWSTKRKETDIPIIISGFHNGRTTGTPLCALIENSGQRTSDYGKVSSLPRPGHADYTGTLRYNGAADLAGGGHFSGRLTAPLTFAGALCIQILEQLTSTGIYSHIYSISDCYDIDADSLFRDTGYYKGEAGSDELIKQKLGSLGGLDFPVFDENKLRRMMNLIEEAAAAADSVGGIVETIITGFPAGIGDPIFEGMESLLASAIFSIPAVKGVEFGAGFKSTHLMGSENNDTPFYPDSVPAAEHDKVKFRSNNSGGLLGGITSGMPIIIRVAVKPTASVGILQETIDLESGTNSTIEIKGRHDPCIVPRALPVIDSVCAIVLLDSLLSAYSNNGTSVKS